MRRNPWIYLWVLHPLSPSVPGAEEGVLCFFQNKIVKPVSCSALMYSGFLKTLYLGCFQEITFSRQYSYSDSPKRGQKSRFLKSLSWQVIL